MYTTSIQEEERALPFCSDPLLDMTMDRVIHVTGVRFLALA
jgi:hypothetical protein